MPQINKIGMVPIPIIILAHGPTGCGKTSLPLLAKNTFGKVYIADAEHQAQHMQGENYPKFIYDPVNTAAEVEGHIARISNKDTSYAIDGEFPKVLVIDTLTVLKDAAENDVYDSKNKTSSDVIFDSGMWARAKRPIRFLLGEIQRSQCFDLVYLLARSKPEMEGIGNSAKFTGRSIPDLPRGADYTPNLILEISSDHRLTIKKTKPSMEALLSEGLVLSFDDYYHKLQMVLNSAELLSQDKPRALSFIRACEQPRSFERILAVSLNYLFGFENVEEAGNEDVIKKILKNSGYSGYSTREHMGIVSKLSEYIMEDNNAV